MSITSAEDFPQPAPAVGQGGVTEPDIPAGQDVAAKPDIPAELSVAGPLDAAAADIPPVTDACAVSVGQVLAFLQRLAPPSLALDWDNVGALVECEGPVHGILTALDITAETVAEAQQRDCQLIVSHHPVLFHPLRRLHYNNVIYKMVRAGISGICMHTNLDSAAGGTGDTLAALLGLEGVTAFAVDGAPQLGRIGSLPQPMTLPQLAALCARRLQTPVRYVPAGRPVRRVAVVTGAGDEVADALAAGAEALVTGEAGYHQALDAAAAGLGLIAAGHYGTEAPIAAVLAQKLAAAFPGLRVQCSAAMHDVFVTCDAQGEPV